MPLPLKDAYDRRVLMFQDHFASASAAPSADAIHEMRVALKRLRTFFDLVKALDPGFEADEAFAGARKLFRAAGRVRNVQVLEAEAYRSAKAAELEISEFYNWLKEAERKAVRRFSRACGEFRSDFFDSAWKRMSVLSAEGLTGRRLRKGLESRLLTLLREMRRAAAGRRNGRRLHALRMRAKEARYTLEILEECGLTGEEGARLNEHLRDVHQALGRWHDEAVVLGSVREFRSGREPAPLVSPKSYLEFGRLARVRQAEDLDSFEAAWAALLAFLGRGTGRRVFRSALSGPRAALGPEGELAAGG